MKALLLVLFLLTLLLQATSSCSNPECYSSGDCDDGSTCCDGLCTGVQPLPLGPADCTAGCECESWMDGSLERSMCFEYEGSDTTQCTQTCSSDSECVSSDGALGECLELSETLLLERVCIWRDSSSEE